MYWPDTVRRKRPTKQKRAGERNVDRRFQQQLKERESSSSTWHSWMDTSDLWPMYYREWQGICHHCHVSQNQPKNELKYSVKHTQLKQSPEPQTSDVTKCLHNLSTTVYISSTVSGDGNDNEQCFCKSHLLSYSHSFVGVDITSIQFQPDTTPHAHCIRVLFLYSCTKHYHSLTWQPV